MEQEKLATYLERRIQQSEDLKMNPDVHKADKLFFNGQGQAFQEIINFLNGTFFINEKGELEYFEKGSVQQVDPKYKAQLVYCTGDTVVKKEHAPAVLKELEKYPGNYGEGIGMNGLVLIEKL